MTTDEALGPLAGPMDWTGTCIKNMKDSLLEELIEPQRMKHGLHYKKEKSQP